MMIFGHHTPESLLSRSDSKNPATTCKGITAVGRSCRRVLGAQTGASLAEPEEGVLAILDAGDAAAFFCWQHKDQADLLTKELNERTRLLPLNKKSSIDTLAERVGILDLEDENSRPAREPARLSRKSHNASPAQRREQLPQEWQRLHGPLMSVPEEVVSSVDQRPRMDRPQSRPRPRSRQRQELRRDFERRNARPSWNCCGISDDDYHTTASRRRQLGHKQATTMSQTPAPFVQSYNPRKGPQPLSASGTVQRKPVAHDQGDMQQMTQSSPRKKIGQQQQHGPVTPIRPHLLPRHSSTSPPNSQTMALLSYIPPHLTPTTTSALLAELSRPISSADEQGYIYIFWLTPESEMSKPDDDTASQLLDIDDRLDLRNVQASGTRPDMSSTHRGEFQTKTAQALQRYASNARTIRGPNKILLKIGRATNVHRRLSQWTKQCGQNLTLIRYYPWIHSSQATRSSRVHASGVPGQDMVPHVHRVERLIHLELAERRIVDKEQCEACGRSHKEWFEVEATKQGLREVDEVVRRWVSWAQSYNVNGW